jgi:large subunit ribosomal protein L17
MRHQKKGHKLGRTASHRKATLAAMATALIEHKRIETTLAKAKALRSYVEPIITRAKEDTTHNRREVFRHLGSKEAVTELFNEVATQVGDRPGGYTRVIKLGQRLGDNAEMAVVELVDWNDVRPEGASTGRKRTRRAGGRSRRGGAAKGDQPQAQQPKAEKPAKAEKAAKAEKPQQAEAEQAEEAKPTPAPAEEITATPEPPAQGESDKMHDAPKAAAHPDENEHPDAPQGASPGKGEPHPEAGKGDQGVAGGSRHRG